MTGEGWAAIIVALATLCTSITAALVSIAGLLKSRQNSAKIDEVHKLANGLSTPAQSSARDAGHAEGITEGRAAMVAEAGADALARERATLPIRPTP